MIPLATEAFCRAIIFSDHRHHSSWLRICMLLLIAVTLACRAQGVVQPGPAVPGQQQYQQHQQTNNHWGANAGQSHWHASPNRWAMQLPQRPPIWPGRRGNAFFPNQNQMAGRHGSAVNNIPGDPFQNPQSRNVHVPQAPPPVNHQGLGAGQRSFPNSPTPGMPMRLPDRELITQQLPAGGHAAYTFEVPKAGNVSITVLPCHSKVAWNITYVSARVFSHPIYPTGRRRRSVVAPSRKKRCCVTAGVTHNFNFNIAGLNAGLGTSLGDGAITYFQEDSSGGIYEMDLTNTGQQTAVYKIFSTLRPAISPYAQLPGDPQIKILSIRHSSLTVQWMPVRAEPWPRRDITYCVEFLRADLAKAADTHSSSCSLHRMNPMSQSAGCSQLMQRELHNLQPNTLYKVNVYAKNIVSNTETAYLGAEARTANAPVRLLARPTEMTNVLAPRSSTIYQLSVDRVQAMKVMLSPCSDQVSWGILDADGKPVRTFTPPYDGTKDIASSQWVPNSKAPDVNQLQPRSQLQSYKIGTLSLPDMEYVSAIQQPSTIGVIVKNHAVKPAKFELYASNSGHQGVYPELPNNKRVRILRTTPQMIKVGWERVPIGENITYCVLYYPSEESQLNGGVHSTCSYKEVERRNQYEPGACSSRTTRQLTNVKQDKWYDVDVVAKNVHTRKIKAYSSVRAYTAYASGVSPSLRCHGDMMLFTVALLLAMTNI